jgi:hypothetical protein
LNILELEEAVEVSSFPLKTIDRELMTGMLVMMRSWMAASQAPLVAPDVLQRLREAGATAIAAYEAPWADDDEPPLSDESAAARSDAWSHAQVHGTLDDPRPSLSNEDAHDLLALKRKALEITPPATRTAAR